MVARLVEAALRHRAVVLLGAAALLVAGIYAAVHAPLDVFPEFAPPIVEVQTEAPGLAAEDTEALVTTPLERALAGAPGVVTIRSSSIPGLSVHTIIFPYGTDPYRARQVVIERLALAAGLLPPDARPAVSPLASALTTVLAIGLRAEGPETTPVELRDLAEWTIRPRLLAVPGVANVIIYGGGVRQLQITTTPERLRATGTTLDDLAAAATAANATAGSGFLDRAGQRLTLWSDGRLHSPADLSRASLPGHEAVPVPLAAVADVAYGAAPAVGDAIVNGEPGVVLLVTRHPEVNIIAVTDAVEDALAAVVRILPTGVRVEPAMFRQASFVAHALSNLRRALIAGAVLVMIVLLAFLGHGRAAVVSVVAIPLSLLGAVLVLLWAGASINIMVLGGLAIAVGEVVDDAIIDVENVWRRLRAAPPGARALDIVLAASVEVRSAVVYATLMVALVFLPVFLLGGLEGALFRPLATAYVLATMVSLGVALSVTPALALILLPDAAGRSAPPRLLAALRTRYERALARTLDRPATVLWPSGIALVIGLVLAPFLRLEFLPEFHETNFVMHMTGAPGVGLEESARVGAATARALLDVPGVHSIAQVIGRSTLSEDTFGAERSELMVQLDPDADPVRTTAALRERAAATAGFAFDVKQFLNERIEELLEGAGAELVVRLRGADLPSLESAGRTLSAQLASVPGVIDVHAQGALGAPGVRVRPRRDTLLAAGVSATDLERALRATLGGLPAGRIVDGERQADVVVRLATDAATDPVRLARLPIVTAHGRTVALGTVADVEPAVLRTAVLHEDGMRTVMVRLDARGRSLQAVAGDVAETVAAAKLPAGIYAEVGGEYRAAVDARRRLMGLGALALLGIFALLLLDFGSGRLAALTLVNVPLAFVGGIAAVLIGAGGRLSLGAIVGFVTVFGITIRNGIVLVAHFQHVEAERGAALDRPALLQAAADRLAPILMTALVTGIALLPLLFLGGRAGGEIEQPMALVIVGGLLSSTWLNLFVVPLWYARAARR